ARDEGAVPPRSQLGDRRQVASARVRAEQGSQAVGGAARAAGLLDLDPGAVDRQLQLPDALPALGAPPQGDARTCERVVSGVVVDRRENARLERLAAEIRELESGRSL